MKGTITRNNAEKGSEYILRFGKIFRRFKNLADAERMLTGLRYKTDEGSFDERDYQKLNPLGFINLSNRWLEIRKNQVRCWTNLKNHIRYAQQYFENRNIKNIGYGELEDFSQWLNTLTSKKGKPLSGKSKANILMTLHSFWVWVRRREKGSGKFFDIPEFPIIKYELGWRGTVDKKTQAEILEEVKRLTWEINPKIYLACKILATCFGLRPFELLNVQNEDLLFDIDAIRIKHQKAGPPKMIPVPHALMELLKEFSRDFPKNYFFRHEKRLGVPRRCVKFGDNYLNRQWMKACKNLGIEGVALYGGTRHSSSQALLDDLSPEEIKRAHMDKTNKAFDRYLGQESLARVRQIYERSSGEVISIRGDRTVIEQNQAVKFTK